MSKAVLISIKPEWCALIASGKKTVEVRKNKPKIKTPFKCYIYCSDKNTSEPHKLLEAHSNGKIHRCNGKVWAEFVCDRIDRIVRIGYSSSGKSPQYHTCVSDFRVVSAADTFRDACLSESEANAYLNGRIGYGWHISDFKIYDKPLELSNFYVWKKCNSCRDTGYESTACCYDEACKVPAMITRPPQSWCYVEELKGGED